jgi:hypothetical protein
MTGRTVSIGTRAENLEGASPVGVLHSAPLTLGRPEKGLNVLVLVLSTSSHD